MRQLSNKIDNSIKKIKPNSNSELMLSDAGHNIKT